MMKTRIFACLFSLTLCVQAREPEPSPKSAGTKMKAVVLHVYGGPQVLNYEETPRPEPGDDEVLIRVVAASVNPVDVAIRSGKYAEYFHTTSHLISGMDAAGVAETTGSKISALKAGDPVYAFFTLREEGGIIVTIAGEPDQAALDAHGIRGVSISSAPKGETFAELTRLIEDKKLRPVVTQVFPLSEVAKAQDQIATRHTRGKVVLRVAPDLKAQ
jgi:NADPH:quinone reductase-like Zn-dependent oxidoreductase